MRSGEQPLAPSPGRTNRSRSSSGMTNWTLAMANARSTRESCVKNLHINGRKINRHDRWRRRTARSSRAASLLGRSDREWRKSTMVTLSDVFHEHDEVLAGSGEYGGLRAAPRRSIGGSPAEIAVPIGDFVATADQVFFVGHGHAVVRRSRNVQRAISVSAPSATGESGAMVWSSTSCSGRRKRAANRLFAIPFGKIPRPCLFESGGKLVREARSAPPLPVRGAAGQPARPRSRSGNGRRRPVS